MMAMDYGIRKQDLPPWRRKLDRAVYAVIFIALGWAMSTSYYNVRIIPGLKANSFEWTEATADRFDAICRQHYGPLQFAPLE